MSFASGWRGSKKFEDWGGNHLGGRDFCLRVDAPLHAGFPEWGQIVGETIWGK